MSSKVFCFAPYAYWLIHTQVDAVLASALRLRGADVAVIGCDGLYQSCIVTSRTASDAEAAALCQACSQQGRQFFDERFNLPYYQLRTWIQPEDEQLAQSWIGTVSPEHYADASYGDQPIGQWVTSSIYSYFRMSAAKELARPEVRAVHRQYLLEGVLTYLAISRLFQVEKPTHLILFNGRLAPYRIAFEVARQQGIEVTVHERAFIDDHFSFFDNETCMSTKPFLTCVQAWEGVPLTALELLEVKQYFTARERGLGINWPSFYEFETRYQDVRQKLRIPADAKILTVFTSSEDELITAEDFAGLSNQLGLIDQLMQVFAVREDYLVIRHHPYIAGSKTDRPDTSFITRAYRQALTAPPNVRIIMPSEQLTSYSLLWQADAAIAFFSTVSIEACARGIPVAVAAASPYSRAVPYQLELGDVASLQQLVEQLLGAGSQQSVENFRRLYRFTHSYFFKFANSFHSFGIKDFYSSDLRFTSLEELQPGRDPVLDRICDRILSGTSLYRLPEEERQQESLEAEDAFLGQELKQLQEFRTAVRRQTIQAQVTFTQMPIALIHLVDSRLATVDPPAWIRHSRHACFSLCHCEVSDWTDPQKIAQSIEAIAATCQTEFFLVTLPLMQYDESFCSTALDLLLDDAEAAWGGVLSGAWLTGADGEIREAILTTNAPVANYEIACDRFPLLRYPLVGLGLALLRRETLITALQLVQQNSPAQAAEQLFQFLTGSALYQQALPMVVVQATGQLDSCVLEWTNAAWLASRRNWQAQQDNLEQELVRSQIQIAELKAELTQAQGKIQSMERTKFWKLRARWMQFKQLLRLD